MKRNMGNASVEQIKNDIPRIEIDDSYAYTTGCKIIAYIDINSQKGKQTRTLRRTSQGGYVMQ